MSYANSCFKLPSSHIGLRLLISYHPRRLESLAQLTRLVRATLAHTTEQIDQQLKSHGQEAAGQAAWSALLASGWGLGTCLRHVEQLLLRSIQVAAAGAAGAVGAGCLIDSDGGADGASLADVADMDSGLDDSLVQPESEDALPGQLPGGSVTTGKTLEGTMRRQDEEGNLSQISIAAVVSLSPD